MLKALYVFCLLLLIQGCHQTQPVPKTDKKENIYTNIDSTLLKAPPTYQKPVLPPSEKEQCMEERTPSPEEKYTVSDWLIDSVICNLTT